MIPTLVLVGGASAIAGVSLAIILYYFLVQRPWNNRVVHLLRHGHPETDDESFAKILYVIRKIKDRIEGFEIISDVMRQGRNRELCVSVCHESTVLFQMRCALNQFWPTLNPCFRIERVPPAASIADKAAMREAICTFARRWYLPEPSIW